MPKAPATSSPAPPPATVAHNRWTKLAVKDAAAFTPQASVSVIVTGADPDARLALTVAALSSADYPPALTELVCAAHPAAAERLRALWGERELKLLGDDDLAAAAQRAEGELLVFLRAGALPERELLKAHARWHQAVADAVSIGRFEALDAAGLEPAQVADAQAAGALKELVRPRLAGAQPHAEALEAYLERTRAGTERAAELFALAAGPNIALRSDTLRGAGAPRQGLDDERLCRLDLAYRLELYGCLFVPERAALCYDPYPDGPPPPHTDGYDPAVERLIPVPGFRAPAAGRLFERPAMRVYLDAATEPAADVLASVDTILRGRLADLELRLALAHDHPERELIVAACQNDPRIVVDAPGEDPPPAQSPFEARLPALAVLDERTVADLRELMLEEGVGALHVTVPGELPRNAMIEVTATGPLARARRVAAERDRPPEELLGELFGERWISGVEVSVRRRGASEPQVTEHGPLARATDLEHERTQHARHRWRANTLQARAERSAQRAAAERLRARAERERAARLEARIEEVQRSRSYALLRPLRRGAGVLLRMRRR